MPVGNTRSRESYTWLFNDVEDPEVQALARATGHPPWLATTLVRRGIRSPDALASWLNPRLSGLGDPLVLPDMERGVDRTLTALLHGERIAVFGDYDVDGVTATTLLTEALRVAGADVHPFLPLRMEEGYGLSMDALDRCIEEVQPRLIITVDCGTNSVDAVLKANDAGIDVIITDHHALGEKVAPALAVINPRRSQDDSLHVLAGVGVAFKFVHALVKKARCLSSPPAWAGYDPRTLLDLVALGTIADLVPLVHENRVLATHGLKALACTQRPGLKALMTVAKIGKAPGAYEVAFQIAPRLNAAGRLGNAKMALQLLMSSDMVECATIADRLDQANRERKSIERGIVNELLKRTERSMMNNDVYSIVESDRGWHVGVVGIAATRIAQKRVRPSIVIGADDTGRARGSGRSLPGFNLVEALGACSDLLLKHGGHAMAAGLEIAWENVDAFRLRFEDLCRKALRGRELLPELSVDGWVEGPDFTSDALAVLAGLGPYGSGNPEPLWACRGITFEDSPREVGQGHLKARCSCQGRVFDAIGFGLYDPSFTGEPIDAVFHLRKEVFRGRESMVMHLKDIRPAERSS